MLYLLQDVAIGIEYVEGFGLNVYLYLIDVNDATAPIV